MHFIENLIFRLKKPKVIMVTGNCRKAAVFAISMILKPHYKVGKDILILETDFKAADNASFLIKNSSLIILVVTSVGKIPPDKDHFSSAQEDVLDIKKAAGILPDRGNLIVNFDDESVRVIRNESKAASLTFGFQEGADFLASDVSQNGGINFKITHMGSIVPVWLARYNPDGAPENVSNKEQIYAALAAASCGIILGLNLVEISQALKSKDGRLP